MLNARTEAARRALADAHRAEQEAFNAMLLTWPTGMQKSGGWKLTVESLKRFAPSSIRSFQKRSGSRYFARGRGDCTQDNPTQGVMP